jgi:hypothetical protein
MFGAGLPLPPAFQELANAAPEMLGGLGDQFMGVGGGGGLEQILSRGPIAPAWFVPPPNLANGMQIGFAPAPPPAFAGIADPYARSQLEMQLGGRIMPGGLNGGVLQVMPFGPGFNAGSGAGGPSFALASGLFDQMARAAGPNMGLFGGGQSVSPFQPMMFNGLGQMLGLNPYGQMYQQNPYQQYYPPFQPGVAGPTQGSFGLGSSNGSDVSGVLNDPSLTVEDKVTLMIMLIMKKMDKDIEKQSQDINKLQQQQQQQGGGGGGGGKGGGKGGGAGGAGGGSDKSIDVETMKLKRLIDKRGQMFDMLRQIIDKYNQTAKGIIDSIGR